MLNWDSHFFFLQHKVWKNSLNPLAKITVSETDR